jgi:hypothetical protein
MVQGWRIQQFSRCKKCPLLCADLNSEDKDFKKLVFVLCLKTFMKILFEFFEQCPVVLEKIFKYVPYILAHVKRVSPIVAPPNWGGGGMILTNLLLNYVRKFSCKFQLSGLVVIEKKIFKVFSLYKHIKNSFPHVAPPQPQRP